MGLDIKVIGKRYECELTLRERVTVIVGDSGVGKTCFVKAVMDRSGAYRLITSNSQYEIINLVSSTWADVVSMGISQSKSRVYIIDDEDFTYTEEFAKLFGKVKHCYFIIITRLVLSKSLSRWSMLPFSGNEIYEFMCDGRYHFLRPFYNYSKLTPSNGLSKESVDLCLCEDSKAGYEFAQYIFRFVDTAASKDKLLKYLYSNADKLKGKNIFVLLDFAAIGFTLQECISLSNKLGIKLLYSSRIHSFEYILLQSNLFHITDEEIFDNELLDYLTVERRCTELLKRLTEGTQLQYSKSTLNKCYVEDCCVKDRSHVICDKGMKGCKITSLLKGTKMEFLLVIRQVG